MLGRKERHRTAVGIVQTKEGSKYLVVRDAPLASRHVPPLWPAKGHVRAGLSPPRSFFVQPPSPSLPQMKEFAVLGEDGDVVSSHLCAELCDVACFCYDQSDPNAFEYAANLQVCTVSTATPSLAAGGHHCVAGRGWRRSLMRHLFLRSQTPQ